MGNLVIHFEIHASEPEKLITFYSELLGWKFTQFGEFAYWSIDTGPQASTPFAAGRGINGGLSVRQGPAPSAGSPINGANIVVEADDVDGLVARAIELGGTVAMPAADMEGVGRLAYVTDPDGNLFGIINGTPSDK